MGEDITNLVQLWQESCKKHADKQLFGTKTDGVWVWLTYRDFCRLVDDFRGALAALGVKAGDKVGIVSNNRVEWAVACYATYGLRAAFVPMYEQQEPEEWEFILDDCGAKVAIGATPAIYEKLRAFVGKVKSLEHAIGFEAPDSDPHSYAALLKQ